MNLDNIKLSEIKVRQQNAIRRRLGHFGPTPLFLQPDRHRHLLPVYGCHARTETGETTGLRHHDTSV